MIYHVSDKKSSGHHCQPWMNLSTTIIMKTAPNWKLVHCLKLKRMLNLFFENFNKENFVDFTVAVNNKKALVYQCKFGRKRNPKCTDARPKQHYNNIGNIRYFSQNCSTILRFIWRNCSAKLRFI